MDNVLVDEAGVDVGETNVRIAILSKVIFVDCLLEWVLEALCDRLEGFIG